MDFILRSCHAQPSPVFDHRFHAPYQRAGDRQDNEENRGELRDLSRGLIVSTIFTPLCELLVDQVHFAQEESRIVRNLGMFGEEGRQRRIRRQVIFAVQ